MTQMARSTRWMLWIGGSVVMMAIECLALGLVLKGDMAAYLAVAAGGGAVLAALLVATSDTGVSAESRHDPFAQDLYFTDPLNFAHVRVAGVGGLGLVVVALVVALQFPLLTAALALGLAGGAVAARILVVHRRGRPAAGPTLPH